MAAITWRMGWVPVVKVSRSSRGGAWDGGVDGGGEVATFYA